MIGYIYRITNIKTKKSMWELLLIFHAEKRNILLN